jgi:hypothetical protein
MPNNYILLDRIELNASAASITFDNIPQTGYTDLKVVGSARTNDTSSYGDAVIVRFNGSNTGLSSRRLYGTGAGAASISSSANMYAGQASSNGQTSSTFGNFELYIPNYTLSNQKSSSSDGVNENNAANAITQFSANLWTGTGAITSVALLPEVGSLFLQYSSFSLYGLAAVGTTPAIAPKADGGNVISTDGTYWYHAFLSNGTFTPQTNLTADVLVIAGGGGGGGNGGGGGAGGLLSFTSQSLTTTGYACAIGSGGTFGISSATPGTNGINSQFAALTAAVGGGVGQSSNFSNSPGVGGSGGGGNGSTSGAAGTSGQGFAGGNGFNASQYGNGGGGGATAIGANGTTSTGGNGGTGSASFSTWGLATATGQNVSGTVYFAGGGGGAVNSGTQGFGGYGGGGDGTPSLGSGRPVAGTANTGGGGGGGGGTGASPNYAAAAGGSGIIIIRYPIAS